MTTEVQNSAAYPFSSIVWVVATFPDGGKLRTTGTMVGRNDLLTLGSSVYSPENGGYATAFELYPGADSQANGSAFTPPSITPYRVENFSFRIKAFPAEVYGDSNDSALSFAEMGSNLALIGLSIPLGDTTGWFRTDPAVDFGTAGSYVGYPAGAPGQMRGAVTVRHDQSNSLYLANSANGGLDGAPAFGAPLWLDRADGPYLIGLLGSNSSTDTVFVDIGRKWPELQTELNANDTLLPALPSLAISAASADAAEGSNGAGASLSFSVKRSGVSSSAVSVRYQVSSTAADASDFVGNTLPSGTLNFAAGETTKTIIIPISGDNQIESDESFTVTLISPTGASLDVATAVGVIRNDDSAGTTVGGSDIPGAASTGASISLDSNLTGVIDASGDRDWYRFNAQAGQLVVFEVLGSDSASVSLADPNVSLRDSSGVEQLSDDDFGPGLSSRVVFRAPANGTYFLDVGGFQNGTGSYQLRALSDASADPDAAGGTSTTRALIPNEMQLGRRTSATDADWYRVSLQANTVYELGAWGIGLQDPLVVLRAADGSVLATNDDAADSLSPLIQFRPTTSGSFYIDVNAYNPAETGSYVVYANATDAFTTSTFSFGSASYAQTEGNSGSRPLQVTVQRSGDLGTQATIQVQLLHGSTDDNDLDLSGATRTGSSISFPVSFGAGSNSAQLNLLLRGDTASEPDEQFTLRLSAEAGQTTGAIDSATVRIQNDDGGAAAGITPVFRFAKISNGAYFFTGSQAESNQIATSYPDFRPEGVGFYAFANPADGVPVFRFANLSNGGYFYTGSLAERDATIANYPNMRYEGSTFSVAAPNAAGSQPVYRLANLNNGAYLYTNSAFERDAAQGLGFWRYEGISFHAPTAGSSTAADDFKSDISTSGRISTGQLIGGAIETAGDTDWFAITLDAGRPYTFSLGSPPDNPGGALRDPLLAIWNASGQLLQAVSGTTLGSARLDFTPSLSGTYFLDAQGNGGARGNYALGAQTGSSTTDDFAASSATTGRAAPGAIASGSIERSSDVDWLAINLEAGRQYTITIAAAAGSGLRPAADLLNAGGVVLAGNGNTSAGSSIQFNAAPSLAGTFFIAVRSASTGGTGSYTVNTQAGANLGGIGSVAFVGDEKPVIIEGSPSAPGRFEVSLQRTGATNSTASVTVRLALDEDASNQDVDAAASGFNANERIVTFGTGQDTVSFSVQLIGDTREELSLEGFHLRLSNPVNLQLGSRTQIRLMIQDDDRGGGAWNPGREAMADAPLDPGSFELAIAGTLPPSDAYWPMMG